jgi:hypothetical protein
MRSGSTNVRCNCPRHRGLRQRGRRQLSLRSWDLTQRGRREMTPKSCRSGRQLQPLCDPPHRQSCGASEAGGLAAPGGGRLALRGRSVGFRGVSVPQGWRSIGFGGEVGPGPVVVGRVPGAGRRLVSGVELLGSPWRWRSARFGIWGLGTPRGLEVGWVPGLEVWELPWVEAGVPAGPRKRRGSMVGRGVYWCASVAWCGRRIGPRMRGRVSGGGGRWRGR